ncbi:UNKNOWN [Stylonychia lemnae]|uniref:Uncharacterized protein n=1 Tax=Stylonychia lemnae TaxID=5949 RepID=A0A078AZ66_STYLE|nr:UNKNOWN [Stylonychia lemnae]|eukprot:CDW87745.1 UNKNOWN [Stylonychia lemnae]
MSAVGKGSFQTENIGHYKGNHNYNSNNNHHGNSNAHPVIIKIGSLRRQNTTQSSKNTHALKTQQSKKNRKKIKAEDAIKVDHLEVNDANKQQQNMRGNEQGLIQELHKETYQTLVKINAEQFASTITTAIEHFSANYGETLNMKTAVEYAPKFDYNLLEKENKELHKQYDPIKKELKKEKKNNRNVQMKYDKLMANVNYTKQLKKRYEVKLEGQRDQLKELQFYYNDLKEATERERISRENHVLIFKRIINKIENERSRYSQQSVRQLQQQMEEFLQIADGKMIPKNMNEYIFKGPEQPKKTKTNNQNTVDTSIQARDNPPTTTNRTTKKEDDPQKSDRTIDIAFDYIKRLEAELKTKNNEHQFLKSRLEKALEKKAHPSVGSWQNSDVDILAQREDDFEKGNYPNSNDRHRYYNPSLVQSPQPTEKNPHLFNLKLPIQFLSNGDQQVNNYMNTVGGKPNKDILLNLKASQSSAQLRPKTAINRKELTTQKSAQANLFSTQTNQNKLQTMVSSPDDFRKTNYQSTNAASTMSSKFNFKSPQQQQFNSNFNTLQKSQSQAQFAETQQSKSVAQLRPQTAHRNINITIPLKANGNGIINLKKAVK